tara:strand:+ start:1884 stop:2492 length:609 start_codon:yes stop_codon:yes gene_type:complete
MKPNNVIEKIKDVLNLNEKVKLEQAKLENGTIIEAESYESGKEVFIVTEDDKVAMPVGEYELEDATILVVEEEGVIAEMRKATEEKEVEEEVEEEVDEDLAEEADVADWKGMEKRIKNLEDAIADLKGKEIEMEELSAIEAGNNFTVELSKEIPAELQAELDQPAAEPIATNPNEKQVLSKFRIGAKREPNTMDRILSQLNK